MVWRGEAGMARLGMARHGPAGRGKAGEARQGKVDRGMVWHGEAGMARRGWARPGAAGKAWREDSFKQAGTKVFSKAQYRMEMIARTEVLRAHNMGRLKFHERVGIQKLEWLAMEDERTCPVCGPLDGKTFPIDKFPGQPAHPFCRCTNLPVLSDIKLKNI